eukprot:3306163-Pyramimonas_sp.AAC.1
MEEAPLAMIGLIQYGTHFDPPPWAYGGIHPHRRESLMLLAELLIWKMRSARMYFLAKSYDMRNAFATGSHERL